MANLDIFTRKFDEVMKCLDEEDNCIEYEGTDGRLHVYCKGDSTEFIVPPNCEYVRRAMGMEKIH
jgi:hypothetical protein